MRCSGGFEGLRASREGRTARIGRRRLGAVSAAVVIGSVAGWAGAAEPPIAAPTAFGVANRPLLLSVHAEGAQVYECKAGGAGQLGWAFREPVATLINGGRTVGRHYAGPTWELTDGALVQGQPAASAPGATPDDVALLKLDVIAHRGTGALSNATTVLRLHTRGGVLTGPCPASGDLRAVSYSADYVFLR